ncbi:Hypothetical predicted protein [Marmota monax]|uniref:Uncharacterized protein n=1 Tax=Marmota monax TaxID=9995 RepID=A0A5E4BC69_MARMO|nr:Hypothetical predicted protein [Marmota monax]
MGAESGPETRWRCAPPAGRRKTKARPAARRTGGDGGGSAGPRRGRAARQTRFAPRGLLASAVN